MRMIRENNIKPGDVEKVDVGANHAMTTSLLHHDPMTGLQGKFSMEFCMSILLLDRKAGLVQFQDDVVQHADVQEMIKRSPFLLSIRLSGKSGLRQNDEHHENHSEGRKNN